MQSPSPLALAILLWAACARGEAPPTGGVSGAASGGDPATDSAGYPAARAAATDAGRTLKARLHARDEAARRTWEHPDRERCAALAQAAVEVDAAWAEYVGQLERMAVAAIGHPRHAESARLAARTAAAERGADVRYTADWAAWCAALPATRPVAHARAEVEARCGHAWIDRAVIRRGARGAATIDHVRWMAARFEDTLDFLFVIRLDTRVAPDDAAHVWFERGGGGVGRAPWDPAHLPAWRALRAAIVIDGIAADARTAPTLRALARTFAHRGAPADCAQPHEGWGISDVGGQLGGGGGIALVAPGRYRVTPLRPGGRLGIVGNGGNGLPYAPLEQHLLGHLPLSAVPVATLLRDPRPLGDGIYAARGACRLTGAEITRRFGARPVRQGPWRVGALLVADPATPAAALRRQVTALEAFTRPGPDDDALLFNYFEATEGRGRLEWIAPTARGCGPRVSAAAQK